jgi:hypothetical protein
VRRILRVKFKLGLFDPAAPMPISRSRWDRRSIAPLPVRRCVNRWFC